MTEHLGHEKNRARGTGTPPTSGTGPGLPLDPQMGLGVVSALCHTPRVTSAVFDDPNLVSRPGWSRSRSWPLGGAGEVAQQHLSVPTDKGSNAGVKVASLVAGMVAGADTSDDMARVAAWRDGSDLRPAPMHPSTLGSFLRIVHLRPCPPARRGRLQFLTGLAARRRCSLDTSSRAGDGRHRRHDHPGPRLLQAGLRLRLLRDPRAQRPPRHCDHHRAAAPVIVAHASAKGSCG